MANRETLTSPPLPLPPLPDETVRLLAEGPADKLGNVNLSRGEGCTSCEEERRHTLPPVQKEVRMVYVGKKSAPPPVDDPSLRERIAYLEGRADAVGTSNAGSPIMDNSNTVTIENSISPSGEQTTFARQVYVERVVPAGGYYDQTPYVQYAQPYPISYGYGGYSNYNRRGDRVWQDIHRGIDVVNRGIDTWGRINEVRGGGGCQYGCVNPCNHGQQQQYQQYQDNPGSYGHNGYGVVRRPRGPR